MRKDYSNFSFQLLILCVKILFTFMYLYNDIVYRYEIILCMKPVLLSQHAVYTVCFCLLKWLDGCFKQSLCIPQKISLNILGGKFWGWNFLKKFGSEPRQLPNNFLNFSDFEPRLLIKCLLTKKKSVYDESSFSQ